MMELLERGAGILLPIYSLPSPYGIGTLGREACEFLDFLSQAKQKYWQVLPVGPAGYGDSPYQCYSAFAGNPLYIDLDLLCQEGLLEQEVLEQTDWGTESMYVDYDQVREKKFPLLRQAFTVSSHQESNDYKDFCQQNQEWLEDYALFMACKEYFQGVQWLDWEEEIRLRLPQALEDYRCRLSKEVDYWKFLQYKFYQQWQQIKDYASRCKVRIIGDMPIYPALDSADVWANPDLFQLDEELQPSSVAGVPPDLFSEEGQLWGNPLYDWEAMEKDDFTWWRSRVAVAARLFDVVRIDHFIGIVRYFSIPAGKKAVDGTFFWGPGRKLTDALTEAAGDLGIIAEDLGVVIDEVRQLKRECGFPGMKVLEFAFDGGNDNEHLPINYDRDCIVYGGTHDNETLKGFFDRQEGWTKEYAMEYMGLDEQGYADIVPHILRLAYGSVARAAIFQAQDILRLGNEARTNEPSTVGDNWKWRLRKGQLGDAQIQELSRMAWLYRRD